MRPSVTPSPLIIPYSVIQFGFWNVNLEPKWDIPTIILSWGNSNNPVHISCENSCDIRFKSQSLRVNPGNRIHPLLSAVKSLNPFQVQINQYRYSRSIIRRRSIQKPEFFRILKIYLIKTSIKNASEHAGILSPFMELPLSISKNPSARQMEYGWKQIFAF